MHLDRIMDEVGFASLTDLSRCCIQAAMVGGSTDRGPYGIKRPEKSWELQELLRQRRACQDRDLRSSLSKAINRCTKKQLRS